MLALRDGTADGSTASRCGEPCASARMTSGITPPWLATAVTPAVAASWRTRARPASRPLPVALLTQRGSSPIGMPSGRPAAAIVARQRSGGALTRRSGPNSGRSAARRAACSRPDDDSGRSSSSPAHCDCGCPPCRAAPAGSSRWGGRARRSGPARPGRGRRRAARRPAPATTQRSSSISSLGVNPCLRRARRPVAHHLAALGHRVRTRRRPAPGRDAPRSPVSSATSRTAANGMVSPRSSLPLGNDQSS